jgi:hypothetical protein
MAAVVSSYRRTEQTIGLDNIIVLTPVNFGVPPHTRTPT